MTTKRTRLARSWGQQIGSLRDLGPHASLRFNSGWWTKGELQVEGIDRLGQGRSTFWIFSPLVLWLDGAACAS